MTNWQDAVNPATGKPTTVLDVTVTLAVRTVATTISDARLRRLHYSPEIVVARLFSLWCHKQGYFYSRTEPLCSVRIEIEHRPDMGTDLYHFYADYGVPA